MNIRDTALAVCLLTLLAAASAWAGTNDLLVGLDSKIAYERGGQVNGPPGKDAVLVMDISNPAKPRIRASLPLMNSLLGPPTNLQITPDGRLGLVANSLVMKQVGSAWKTAPDDKLFVIDLGAAPKLIDTVTVGQQPSGLAISHKGDLALVANRAGKSISVLSIAGDKVKLVATVPLGQEASSVAIAPDGTRAFATLNLVDKVAMLAISGQKVTYDKTLDIPAGFVPFNIDMTTDGKYAVASDNSVAGINSDAEVTILATGPHPHVVAFMTAGHGPEGFAISPNGKWAAAPLLLGTGALPSDPSFTKNGQLALMSIGAGGNLTVVGRARLGALPEGIAYSPDSNYIYVGNYIDQDLQVFHIEEGRLVQVGPNIKLPGQPASIRSIAR